MVLDWYEKLTLSSEWQPEEGDTSARYTLRLKNGSEHALSGFGLGFSGLLHVSADAPIEGGRILKALSNYCEVAPPPDITIAPGETWTIILPELGYPLQHWTDGVVTGFLILDNGETRSLRTIPTALAGSDAPRRRGSQAFPLPAHPPESVAVIPWPRDVQIGGRRTVPAGLSPVSDSTAGTAAIAAFDALVGRLFPGEGLMRPAREGGIDVRLVDGPGGPEGYEISFADDAITITAETRVGHLYGLITLGQILRGARRGLDSLDFPTSGAITDAPELRWRGCHLDVARRLYDVDEVEQFLAILAWNKLNAFHWHLSDDEAWRVEIAAVPELTDIGAWRGYGLPIPPLLGTGPERTGGYYTKADVRRVVTRAAEWGIDVVPEIDVPGHCYAVLQALPQLADPTENGSYSSVQAFTNNCLNPAVEAVYTTLETIFGELVELFPSRYFHVGADEVPADAWASSAAAKELASGLGGTGAAPLQAHLLQRIQSFLTSQGKITGAWEEAAQGGGVDSENSYLVGWHTVEASQRLAARGYDVVVAPGQAYYLDMAIAPEWHECGASWAGFSSVEATYAFDPADGWSDAERQHLLGVQACIWSEPMTDRAVFDRLVFPRLSAIAETGWTAPAQRNYARFAAFAGLMPNLHGFYEGH
ncbi:beta-N-acetylhexosaminidase [Devosia sp.]|uniref:beta-N-acetylhexosaminidase n=1 Tax=Devosia sp. TaxID=1871048 RepID=UPI003A8D02CA